MSPFIHVSKKLETINQKAHQLLLDLTEKHGILGKWIATVI